MKENMHKVQWTQKSDFRWGRTVKKVRNNLKSICFYIQKWWETTGDHGRQCKNHWFYSVLRTLDTQKFDFHLGHTVKKVRNH